MALSWPCWWPSCQLRLIDNLQLDSMPTMGLVTIYSSCLDHTGGIAAVLHVVCRCFPQCCSINEADVAAAEVQMMDSLAGELDPAGQMRMAAGYRDFMEDFK